MKRLIVTAFLAAAIMFMLIPDSYAPEITERDIMGYDTYRVAEGGAILDADGVLKGWVLGSTVYDTGWDVKYVITKKTAMTY
ncbi:MAG TPA: hypothetical protein PLA81_11520 [Syntrophorhabdaceae bacterium]|nr:hypothetical protein [Syntrophorhabdaceae bacterium]